MGSSGRRWSIVNTLFFGNNQTAVNCMEWMCGNGHQPVGLVLNPESTRRHAEELIDACGLSREFIFDGAELAQKKTIASLAALKPDIGLSVLYDQIIKPEVIDLFPAGIVNLHPGFLPYNRGNYPNVWSIVDGTPAGVTLHYIDDSLDTGDVIAQRKVEVLPVDTGKTLYHKLENAMSELLRDEWSKVLDSQVKRVVQDLSAGTYHRRRDVDSIDSIDLDGQVRAGDLIDILRARTFPPYRGAFFEYEGRQINVRIDLSYADEERSESSD
ncbi:MAG: hypothetical protein MK100_03875 [Phycisphaerales bacterium]|nr:hypothetical protein [Phycisphaerales bacterium]